MPCKYPAYLVAGLAFGDEGKGSVVDALVRRTGANLVIRYNGGAQCAHNVVNSDGTHHTFAQFGSGTFVPGVRTYLSRFVLINPVSMMMEAQALQKIDIADAYSRLSIDHNAVVITPYQRTLNRLQEIARGDKRHGSTGMGIGIAREDHIRYGDAVLMAKDLQNSKISQQKLEWFRDLCKERSSRLDFAGSEAAAKELKLLNSITATDWYIEQYAGLCRRVKIVDEPPKDYTGLVFEGAQGMLLDETHGFQPHTTWTDITFRNAETILKEMGYIDEVHKVGVLRTYYTRHGAGPFPTESDELKNELGKLELHNKPEEYTGHFRVGAFDFVLAKKALHDIGGVHSLAINHVDVVDMMKRMPVRLTEELPVYMPLVATELLMKIQEMLAPISMLGYGSCPNDKEFLPELESAHA